ncbi:tetratricopeptide repeat protein [Anabaena sp. FACHB-1237]|nr:tetratricopeptide repeat protein [Anabaena sp. FACHB-1237]
MSPASLTQPPEERKVFEGVFHNSDADVYIHDENVANDQSFSEATVDHYLSQDKQDHALSHHDCLAIVEPQIAEALDELSVRLEQTTSLVQQLASNLGVRDTNKHKSEIVVFNEVNQAEILFHQGLEETKAGNLLAALALYTAAIKLDDQAYKYWYNQGLILFYLQRLPEAIAAYDKALELKPDLYKAWYNRGGILGELGDFNGAVISFEKAIIIKSDYQPAWASKGLALLKLGLVSEAIISYDQALSLNGEDPEIWYYRGVALAVSEQYAEAISSYDKAISIKPDYYEVWIDRGVVLFNLKQWSEAIASWDRALAIQPELYLAWYNRGVALENLGMGEEAIGSYQQAITIKPDFHPAWYNKALGLFHLKRFPQSIACYDSALQIKLDSWEAWLGRGAAAASLGENESLSVVSPFAVSNPALNLGGYEGKLASYQEGLKHLRPDTHPEGWGRLYIAIGNTYYEQGKKEFTHRDYWHQAISNYQIALSTLTPEDFPESHLEILQSLTKVLVNLRENATGKQLQSWGMQLLKELLSQSYRSDENKKQLALKFIGLQQLGVDIAVNNGDLVEAWELAEKGKNQCLQWLTSHDYHEVKSAEYSQIQRLLNPTTAIIYWHFSPASLQTFIIKDQAPSPILLFTPIKDSEAIPEAAWRLLEFENWFADWQNSQPSLELQIFNGKQSQQLAMETKLLKLQKILNISTILQEFEGIETIILVPHRDLYKLPLHSLFNLPNISGFSLNIPNYKIVYLPTVQLGIASENYGNNGVNNGYSGFKSAELPLDIVGEMFGITEDVLSH